MEARDATDIPVVVDDMTRDGGVASARGAQNAALSFFCPDVTDASTLKRVQQFMDFGYSVTVFSPRALQHGLSTAVA
jgi:succinoglycan biosynthesis protein ExoL